MFESFEDEEKDINNELAASCCRVKTRING